MTWLGHCCSQMTLSVLLLLKKIGRIRWTTLLQNFTRHRFLKNTLRMSRKSLMVSIRRIVPIDATKIPKGVGPLIGMGRAATTYATSSGSHSNGYDSTGDRR